ncbi:MAG: energy transducer TonB [candidate division WOR-3 bacterium]
MNTKLISLISTAALYLALILFFLLVSVNLKSPEEEFVTLGFQVIEDVEEKGTMPEVGGTEDIFSSAGDIAISTEKTRKSLSPLEKPPYEGGEIEQGEREGYKLVGELAKRKIIHFKKPEYPEKESENTEVNLEIEVNPDGTVKTIRVVKTGGISFDNNAMEAVRDWRFQPLAPKAKQSVQTGIVTIYFEIK